MIAKKLFSVPFAVACLALCGCPDDGPLEEAGEKVDEAADEVGDAVEDAVDQE